MFPSTLQGTIRTGTEQECVHSNVWALVSVLVAFTSWDMIQSARARVPVVIRKMAAPYPFEPVRSEPEESASESIEQPADAERVGNTLWYGDFYTHSISLTSFSLIFVCQSKNEKLP